jgi:hypothetical protein
MQVILIADLLDIAAGADARATKGVKEKHVQEPIDECPISASFCTPALKRPSWCFRGWVFQSGGV